MKIEAPKLHADLYEVYDLMHYVSEGRLTQATARGRSMEEADAREWTVRGCRLERCRLTGARLEKSEFFDVAFVGCDLTGADLTACFFERCSFTDCKMVGTSFYDAVFHDVTCIRCHAPDVDFRGTRWKRARLERCALVRALMGECTLSGFEVSACDLSRVNCFRTALKGIDLSDSMIDGIQVVGPELKGAVVDTYQAAGLAKLLGVIVKE